MKNKFKYKAGDIIEYLWSYNKIKVLECISDSNGYKSYKTCKINGEGFVTPYVDAHFLENNTKNVSRYKKLERIINDRTE